MSQAELRGFIQVLLDLTITSHMRINYTLKSLHMQGGGTDILMPTDRLILVGQFPLSLLSSSFLA